MTKASEYIKGQERNTLFKQISCRPGLVIWTSFNHSHAVPSTKSGQGYLEQAQRGLVLFDSNVWYLCTNHVILPSFQCHHYVVPLTKMVRTIYENKESTISHAFCARGTKLDMSCIHMATCMGIRVLQETHLSWEKDKLNLPGCYLAHKDPF